MCVVAVAWAVCALGGRGTQAQGPGLPRGHPPAASRATGPPRGAPAATAPQAPARCARGLEMPLSYLGALDFESERNFPVDFSQFGFPV